MQVKKQLQNTLGLERDSSLSGLNVQHAVVNQDTTVSFIDKSVDQFIKIDRREAVSAEVSGLYRRCEDGSDDVGNHVVRFESGDDRTHIMAQRLIDIAVAVDAHPDELLSAINWQMLGNRAPVLFTVPAEGWVAIAPVLADETFESPMDSFTDFACVDEQ
jgi:hypothetical protein